VKGSRSKASSTSSGSKDFQKARVIPILNAKAIPELVTSSMKHPETSTGRRRVSTNRSVDKQQPPFASSKANKGKLSRSNQETRVKDKNEKQEETETPKEERVEYSTTRNTSSTTTDKSIVSRRRNTASRVNTRKPTPQPEATVTTTEANINRKRIPIRIKGTEREKQPKSKDTSSSPKSRNVSRNGRENIGREDTSSDSSQEESNNGTEAVSKNETENTTTPAPRRLQAIEHRRVTKEEIFTTTYFPEDELAMEMERQSELDAAELEAADESPEKVSRGTSDEEDDDEEEDEEEEEEEEEEEDIYEPYESYHYESRHIKHPGNRLQNEDKPYSDENWNSKRGYYIFHEPDHSPYDYYHPHRTHKENKRTRPYESNHHDYERTGNKSEPTVPANSQDPGKDYDGDGSSKQTLTPEDPTKAAAKDGTKGFYIQRPLGTASTSPSSNRSKGDNKDRSSGKVLTYIVNQKTGIGSWVPSDDTTDTVKTTDTSEANKEEKADADGPTGVSVRGSFKSRNNWRKQNGEALKEQKNAERSEDQKPEVEKTRDEQVESSGRNRNVSDKIKTNRGKPQRGKYSSDHDTERYKADADKISGDRSSKPTNIKQASQNRLRKNPGKPRQKDNNTETVAQVQDDSSDLNKSDYNEKDKNSGKILRGKAGKKQEFILKDDGDEEASDITKLDEVSKLGKSRQRKNKSRRYKGHANQFEDTDANIDSSASEAKYYEEELPVATVHDEEQEDYKHETSDEEGHGDEDEYREEPVASAFGKILSQTPPKVRGHSEDVKEAVDHVPPYVKNPAERYYYYADVPEEVPGKEKKEVQAGRTSRSYRDKQLRRKDETMED
jgi:hypothetical protein